MKHDRDAHLIREYVKQVLKEDDYGGLGMGGMGFDAMGATGGYGEILGRDQLYNIFIDPFVNAAGTIIGKTKELSQRGLTLARVALEATLTSLIPIVEDSYKEIFAEEAKELQRIKQEYGKYYNEVWNSFANGDLAIAAFMYRPDIFLSAKLLPKAPKAALKLFSVLTGGTFDSALGLTRESVLREDAGDVTDKIASLMKRDDVRQAISDNESVGAMSNDAKGVIRGSLEQAYDKAREISMARSIGDIEKRLGKRLKGSEGLQKLPEQERQKAEQVVLAAAKKSSKAFYSKMLQKIAQDAIAQGVPQDHPFIKDHLSIAKKIQAL